MTKFDKTTGGKINGKTLGRKTNGKAAKNGKQVPWIKIKSFRIVQFFHQSRSLKVQLLRHLLKQFLQQYQMMFKK